MRMVFCDLAQGAYRMRGIAKGQTIAMLVIPEVAQLMKRQLAKARAEEAPPPPSPPPHPPPPVTNAGAPANDTNVGAPPPPLSQAQQLQDVAAWLTLNSMRTERTQFDQLCAQNLATIWRQNAWEQLIAGHQHFKVRPRAGGRQGSHDCSPVHPGPQPRVCRAATLSVQVRPECVQGFVQEKLGEAYMSDRLGKVPRSPRDLPHTPPSHPPALPAMYLLYPSPFPPH